MWPAGFESDSCAPRYSMISCKWYYCKVEAFRNHSNSAYEIQPTSGINISTKSVHRELHGMGFYDQAAPVGVMYFVYVMYII